jgi:hypothetical protein
MVNNFTSMLDNFAISTKTVECRLVIMVWNFDSFELKYYHKMLSFGMTNFELEIVEKPNLWLGVLNSINWLDKILDWWYQDQPFENVLIWINYFFQEFQTLSVDSLAE